MVNIGNMDAKQNGVRSITTALEYLERAENELAKLYEWLQDLYESDPEASALFRTLKYTENAHANLLAFQRRIVMRERRHFGPIEIDLASLEELLARIEKIRALDPPPDLDRMISLLLEVENLTCDRCYRDAIIQANPAIAGLINSMTSSDEQNLVILRDFALARGIPVN